MKPGILQKALFAGLLALLIALPAAAANPAGTAVFVSGVATATGQDGVVRTLKSRDAVYSGDMLKTGKGRIQIKYLDGAFMSIQPNSDFQIEEYNYQNQSDGSEKAVYNLIKGGMRAFTGAIGKKHPDAYKVKTPVATIGIRGTGHNTRVCAGNCTSAAGLPLPDGLYHSTWEGTTTLENEFGISVVDAGRSVFVEGVDAPAEESSSASQVTAADVGGEQDSQPTLQAGEQVSSTGERAGIPPIAALIRAPVTELTQLPEQTVHTIEPANMPGPLVTYYADSALLSDATVLVGSDSVGTNGLAGTFGTQLDENDSDDDELRESLITNNPQGVLAITTPDSAVSMAQDFITDALDAGGADAVAVNTVINDPAIVAEHTEGTFKNSNFAHGRWTDGHVLHIDEITQPGPDFGERSVKTNHLDPDQSFAYVYGESADTNFGFGATGTYDFISGTASTSTNGGPAGAGVQSGSLAFDFTALEGWIEMEVLHDTTYLVSGDLAIDAASPVLFEDAFDGVIAETDGGPCDNGCETYIEGSFFGPLDGDGVDGAPVLAGIDYEIPVEPFNPSTQTGESIIGTAVFGRSGAAAPTLDDNGPYDPVPGPVPDQSILGIETNLYRGIQDPNNADGGIITSAIALTGEDSDSTLGLVGVFGTEFDADDSGTGTGETLEILITISPGDVVENGDAPGSELQSAATLITDAESTYYIELDAAYTNPATIAEHTQGTHQGADYAYGRWVDGNILFIDEVQGGPNDGELTAEVDELGTSEHFHYLQGDSPNTQFGSGATGTYTLLTNGGTASTDTHNEFVGDGIQSGTLTFDFTTLNGTIDMSVLHEINTSYAVSGDLLVDIDRPGQFANRNGGVSALTDSGVCIGGCETLIDGSFFGALAGNDANGAPVLAGLNYEILANPYDGDEGNSIIGNAVFGRSATAAPIPDTYTLLDDQGLVVVLPDQEPAGSGDFADAATLESAAVILGDDRRNYIGVVAFTGTETNNDLDEPETLRVVATIDPLGVTGLSVPSPSVANDALALINDAIDADTQNPTTLVADVAGAPARVAEFFQGDSYAFFRWADGKVLFADENLGSGEKTVDVLTLEGFQSLHGFYGDTPELPTSTGATGEYAFVAGTQSTSVSGATIGQGVTSGTLTFYFGASPDGFINMNVDHLTNYNVTGSLQVDGTGRFFDNTVAATGGICNPTCPASIDGGFAGSLVGGVDGSPAAAGLEYDINLPVDPITGAAAFERMGDAPT